MSAPAVARLLKTAGFSSDRYARSRYTNEQVTEHRAGDEPVISVAPKKRLGRLPMAGREWRPRREPVEVGDPQLFLSGPGVEQALP